MKPKVFIIDVDGVMTTGHFLYSAQGKVMKVFGPDDHDGLMLLAPYLKIQFITSDYRGFEISKRRIMDDMSFPLELVHTNDRLNWIKTHFDLKTAIFMGDGIFDHYVMRSVGYAIAPANADANAKKFAHYVTLRKGGDRAVAEAALHILEKFFQPYNTLTDITPHHEKI